MAAHESLSCVQVDMYTAGSSTKMDTWLCPRGWFCTFNHASMSFERQILHDYSGISKLFVPAVYAWRWDSSTYCQLTGSCTGDLDMLQVADLLEVRFSMLLGCYSSHACHVQCFPTQQLHTCTLCRFTCRSLRGAKTSCKLSAQFMCQVSAFPLTGCCWL